ncbi:SDR family NAD(P)-dependent oxidoreductase [Rhizobium ruizarguesonis]|uniref:(S)-1-Phenylethanol dehydrogenase n=1 Tax=Rhizobium leguminosarum TaxID=384 RepID=A0A2K9Z6S3_RHILE|nr:MULTISPECIES: glucose 1-dehydrogenase [Rhizobium]AUW43929.1 (S)-1-Phenylethanol dehydrogenase [Rhizobium leguminosarum]
MNIGTASNNVASALLAEARDFSVKDRVVLVTGSGQGIGRELARQFAAAGAIAVIADLSITNSENVAKEISEAGGRSLALSVDVSQKDSVDAMVAAVKKEFGRIDVLVNNASLFSALVKRPFDEIPESEWQKVMDVNVNGVFFCAAAAAPGMRDRGFGRIINISSASVHRGTKNYLHYVTSKSALIGMTNSLARELGPFGVTANCIRPGTVATEVAERKAGLTQEILQRNIDLQCIPRTIVPSDLVGITMFLASPAASFITGQTIACDGGYTHSF